MDSAVYQLVLSCARLIFYGDAALRRRERHGPDPSPLTDTDSILQGGTMTQIGDRIRQLREQRRLSQGDIERVTGMLRGYTSRVEHGITVPSLETIERFAGVLGVPLHEMFRDHPEPSTAENAEDRFLALLSTYVHKLSSTDRNLLVSLAHRLAADSKGSAPTASQQK